MLVCVPGCKKLQNVSENRFFSANVTQTRMSNACVADYFQLCIDTHLASMFVLDPGLFLEYICCTYILFLGHITIQGLYCNISPQKVFVNATTGQISHNIFEHAVTFVINNNSNVDFRTILISSEMQP